MPLPHLILWPFKKINDWLRTHYQSKQIQQQTAILEKQLLLDTIPDVVVSVALTRRNPPPKRSDLAYVDVSIRNYGGKTYLIEGHFRISFSNGPAYDQEKHLTNIEMPKSKEEHFSFVIKIMPDQEVITGKSILKFQYEIRFKGVNGQPEEKRRGYQYDPKSQEFVVDAP